MHLHTTIHNELELIIARLKNNISLYAGYPPNTDFDYSALFPALDFPINNLGDPFLMLNPFSSHDFEYRVIEWFLKLYGLTCDDGWGYVTSCGTEGVFFGLWLGREQANKPIVYFSSYGHYSIPKAINVLQLEHRVIKTDQRGEIDYEDFDVQLVHGRDVVIVATLGSTMTSSVDDVVKLRALAEAKGHKVYIHADAAIDGMILPFLEDTLPYQLTQGIDSVSISGHKIIGSPIPCGVVLTHKYYVDKVKKYIDYVANHDATLTGSRSGFAALILWYAIKQEKCSGFKLFIAEAMKRADLYIKKFNDNGISVWKYDHAITLVLEKQTDSFLKKWRVPTNHCYSTLTALPKLTPLMVDEIIDDILAIRLKGNLSNNSKGLLFPDVEKLAVLE